ncbi:HAMP domain-containing protein [Clostridia bacterium]|nr:HAMP domain-containing protein [Clostridia bacterium]
MRRSRLSVKLISIVLILMLIPVLTTLLLYRYNMSIVEKDTVEKMFRERYAIYDQVFDHVEVAYDEYLGIDYLSAGVKQSLDRYNAHLRVVRKDGILLFDSKYPTEVRNSLNMEYELKLISEQGNLFSTNGKYIRPINEGNEVVAYAIIVDDPKEIEDSIYSEMADFYMHPFYYGSVILLLSTILLLIVIYREILKPVKALRVSTRRIAEGQLDFEMSCETNNELGDLCDDFNLMKNSLMSSIQSRLKEKEHNRIYVKNVYDDLVETLDQNDLSEDTESDPNEQLENIRKQIRELLEDLSLYTQGKVTRIRLKSEIVSSYKIIEQLKSSREQNKRDKKNIFLLEPYENSMLYIDRKKTIKLLDGLITRMDEFTGDQTKIYVETVSDLLDYTKLQFKVYWAKPMVIEEFTVEDFVNNVYRKNSTPIRKNLVEALLLLEEILEESSGDMEVLQGDKVTGFILRVPRYTPGIQ